MKDEIKYKPIGIIHTPFKNKDDVPSSTRLGKDIKGTVEVKPELVDGLKDLHGFSHIMLIFNFHESKGFKLYAKPPLDDVKRSLFATRSPARPNPIGISIVKLEKIEGNIIHISNLDMLDGTPLLDIKPYIPHWEPNDQIKIGWLEGKINIKPTNDL
jgi:tRNA-Thr(GGU) m(6)t(6)A37 methyltransferase TsaA